ncbi:hypothetical protein H7142_01565 [Candidatus Saccharibacteria bacterium]|nr:hypothetical protein [Candidatus Saccharibacteria bacterium]
MKRLGWVVLTFIFCIFSSVPSSALETTPTTPNKVTGPLLITGYSFSGTALRYVQIYNNTSTLVMIDGWQIVSTSKTNPTVTSNYITLSGQLEPGKHVFAAIPNLVDRISFELPILQTSGLSLVGSVSLIAPVASTYNDEVATVPTISSSTTKETSGSNVSYYLKRDISATTGNYVSGFTFTLPGDKLKNDQLYQSPQQPMLQVAQIYPDAITCSPFDTSQLCADFVKLHNASTSVIDLSLYRLRTGTYGQAASSSNTRTMTGIVQPNEYVSFPLALSSSGNWVWLEDSYGTTRYEQTAIEYPQVLAMTMNHGHTTILLATGGGPLHQHRTILRMLFRCCQKLICAQG